MGPKPARAWYVLLTVPFVALLFPWYLRAEPALGGVPFFYWYQFALLFFSAALTAVVYVATRERP